MISAELNLSTAGWTLKPIMDQILEFLSQKNSARLIFKSWTDFTGIL